MSEMPERIWTNGLGCYGATNGGGAEYVRSDLHVSAIAERDEARRRRDEWRKKAEGYDAVRKALREKVGAPWPPNLSRAMWAGIAADEKRRADDAEVERDAARAEAQRLREVLREALGVIDHVARGDAFQTADVYRSDGEHSKHDRCVHGEWRYNGCGLCGEAALENSPAICRARALIGEGEG